MPQLGRFARELRAQLWKVPVDEEVESEIAFHLEMLTQENIARGMEPASARAEALRRFGDVRRIDQTCRELGRRRDREMRRTEWLAELRQDTRYALRHLRLNARFTTVATLTLALGIGASTTIFGIADTVLLRPLPFPDPDRLVRLWETSPTSPTFSVSEPNYLDWRARNRSFAELAAYTRRDVSLVGDGDPERLDAVAVTPTFFPLLGARPLHGRVFVDDEGRPGSSARTVVLSHALWQRRFGGDVRAVGRTVLLDGTSYQVVGVMPPSFVFGSETDAWLPLAPSPSSQRDDHRLGVIGRLDPGVTVEQATRDLSAVAAELAREYPASNEGWGATSSTFADWIVGPELRARVIVLLAAVGLLLLMACVNVANLLLARASARQREMSVRAALGAGRWRVVRQLVTESLVLAALGATLGVALAAAAVPVLRRAAAESVPRIDELQLDWRMLAFAVAASLLTGLVFGLVPALRVSRPALDDVLRSGVRVAPAGRLQRALIASSVGLALVLLVGAGLVGRSFAQLMRVDPGFRTAGVLTASLGVGGERYATPEQRAAFYAAVVHRISAIPGVRAAGATNIAPFSGGSTAIPFTVVGRDAASEPLQAAWRSVTPGYFPALGVRLLRGRLVEETDIRGAPRVLVVTETMARRVWPGQDAIGKQIEVSGSTWTVVGVVSDLRDQQLEQEPDAVMYLSYRQVTWPTMWLVVHTASDRPMSLLGAVEREVWAIDKTLPLADAQPLAQLVSDVAAQPRLTLLIFGLFGAAALALAVVGLYGLVTYTVAQRTREIGVRLALGARPARIVGDVVRHGVVLATVGIAGGAAVAYSGSRFLAAILYEVRPTDAATYVAVMLLLVGCAAVASLLPARRAARLEPVLALRDE